AGGEQSAEHGSAAALIHAGDEAKSARAHFPLDGAIATDLAGWMFGGPHAGPLLSALFETRRFAFQPAKVVQLRPPDLARADDVDVIDDPGVQRKDALDPVAEAHLSHGDGFAHTGVVPRDQRSF